MDTLTYTIKFPDGVTFDELTSCRHFKNKFVFFEYIIPLPLFRPIRRISKIFYLRAQEKAIKYSFGYSIFTFFIGWLGLPFGPIYSYYAIKSNFSGIDITDDVLDNLTKEDFEKSIVRIKQINKTFTHPTASNIKDMTKCFEKANQETTGLRRNPIIGYYVNTKDPVYMIGLCSEDMDKVDDLKKRLYKYYYSHIKFEFVNLSDQTEISEQLLTQGLEINCC